MNNINIKNIFTNNILQDNYQDKKELSINTLIKSNTFQKSITDDYIINKIKSNMQCEKNKMIELYEEKYNECLNKINIAIEINMTDVIYNVGLSYFGYKNYNSIECLKYIEKKLKEKKFLTLIMSNKDIFISWKNIIDSYH